MLDRLSNDFLQVILQVLSGVARAIAERQIGRERVQDLMLRIPQLSTAWSACTSLTTIITPFASWALQVQYLLAAYISSKKVEDLQSCLLGLVTTFADTKGSSESADRYGTAALLENPLLVAPTIYVGDSNGIRVINSTGLCFLEL
jgi:hypothetical protein